MTYIILSDISDRNVIYNLIITINNGFFTRRLPNKARFRSIKSQLMILTPDITIQGFNLKLFLKIEIKSIHSIPSTWVRDAIIKIFPSYIPIKLFQTWLLDSVEIVLSRSHSKSCVTRIHRSNLIYVGANTYASCKLRIKDTLQT